MTKNRTARNIFKAYAIVPLLILIMSLTESCTFSSTKIEPTFCFEPTKGDLKSLPSAFPPLTHSELSQEWGRELLIGQHFGKDLDLYRAITAFKRALILIPRDKIERRLQIEYSIVQSYYYGKKHCDAVQFFEDSSFGNMTSNFPAFHDLLIMIYDCYIHICEFDKAEKVLEVISKRNADLANNLQLSNAIVEGCIPNVNIMAASSQKGPPVQDFLCQYCRCSKSPRKAQFFNAILPGAGYYYVGLKRSAVTSFIINGLFTATAVYFFQEGNWPAGLITTSLETGWYLGGINGAGLAAKEYNERLYNTLGTGTMSRNDLFPFLMLETSF